MFHYILAEDPDSLKRVFVLNIRGSEAASCDEEQVKPIHFTLGNTLLRLSVSCQNYITLKAHVIKTFKIELKYLSPNCVVLD